MTTSNSTFNQLDDRTPRSGDMSVDAEGSLIEKESPPPYITFRKAISQNHESDIRSELKTYQENMMSKLETWFLMQDQKFSKLLNEFEGVKTSIKFISDKYDELETKTQEMNRRVLSIEQKSLTSEPRIAALEAKLESMEQRARSCNVEISNLPEKRGENLITIIENISSVLKLPVSARDIVSIHRVPQNKENNLRPKNVVVKFLSQLTRDNFIAAVRLNKGITSDQIQIQGSPQKLYVNEHLTLQNKILFRQTRDKAKQCGYRFVWVKHGVILIRADISTAAMAIRTEKDLEKIKTKITSKQ